MKKNIVVYANCQGMGIIDFLKKNIGDKYNLHHIMNYTTIRYKQSLKKYKGLLKNTDVFIYQPIKKQHKIYSTDITVKDNILTHLKKDCLLISFPYIYNSAFFPTIASCNLSNGDKDLGNYTQKEKSINQEVILELKKKKTLKEIIEMYDNHDINFNHRKRFEECMIILAQNEKECNVKVVDFILQHVFHHRLFLSHNHITTCVSIHCVNQIFKILNYDIFLNPFEEQDENPFNLKELPMTEYELSHWKFNYFKKKDCEKKVKVLGFPKFHDSAHEFYKGQIITIYNNN